ncbi:hypothetical protein L1887_10736 [Cichorium endivia]|nr:hypothetical protein L1887_10736 [Cichorium endivia]
MELGGRAKKWKTGITNELHGVGEDREIRCGIRKQLSATLNDWVKPNLVGTQNRKPVNRGRLWVELGVKKKTDSTSRERWEREETEELIKIMNHNESAVYMEEKVENRWRGKQKRRN